MYARVLTSCVMMLLSILPTQGQWPELRFEEIPILPENTALRASGSRYFARLHNGYYVLDNTSPRWRYLGVESERWSLPEHLIFHPDGTATIGANPVMRIRTDSDVAEQRENTSYSLEYNDSIVCRMVERDLNADTSMTIVRWWNWKTRDTLQIDTIYLSRAGVKQFSIPCGDRTMLCVHNSTVYRFKIGAKPSEHSLPRAVVDGAQHSTIGNDLTHIMLNAGDAWLYSSDHGTSWLVVEKESESCWATQTTSRPNELIAMCGGRIVRIRLPGRAVDTLLLDEGLSGYTQVAHGPLGTMVNLHDSVFVIDDVTKKRRRIDAGLPRLTITDMIYVEDGIAAMSKREIAFRPSHGQWSAVMVKDSTNFFQDKAFSPGYYQAHKFNGGRSFDDLWMNRLGYIHWHRPQGVVHMVMPWGGQPLSFWADRSGSYILAAKVENQVARLRRFNLDGTYRDLQPSGGVVHVVSFDDTAFVALCRDGSYWRTVGGDIDVWELRRLPVAIPSGIIFSESKGKVGILNVGDMRIVAYDAGQYWQISKRIANSVSTITAGGIVYTARIMFDTADHPLSLHIYRELGDTKSLVGFYPLPDAVYATPSLQDIVYDESEHRLFIASQFWVASVQVLNITEIEERLDAASATAIKGYYDLQGRLVAQKKEEIPSPGLYLIISEEGVKKIFHMGQ